MKSFIFLTVLFLSVNSFAALRITSIANASNYLNSKDGVEIRGGTSGANYCSNQITTINTCWMGGGRSSCNLNTICPSTKLSMAVTANASGNLALLDIDKNIIHDFGSYTAGSTAVAVLEWSEICQLVTGDTTCSSKYGARTLKLGIVTDGNLNLKEFKRISFQISGMANTNSDESLADIDGVSDYSLASGNNKAILTEFSAVQDFYVYETAKIVGLRAFYAPADCSAPQVVTTASDSYLLNVNDDKKIVDNQIDGLKNGVRYLFMFGFQDKNGNIGLFKDLQSGNCVDDRHSVTPGRVR